ncbi:MAG: hypothetical protein IMZ50_10415 [Candidatus Atribacteria bacterium]|nr:hypothetical protein [Spirochaetota bacterium]MBE3119152.1 hypothetical protein [Candidatus Atribacteria bacterium]
MTIHERFWRTAKRDSVYAEAGYVGERDVTERFWATIEVGEPQGGKTAGEAMRKALAEYERRRT